MATRPASKAGPYKWSWYEAGPASLAARLDNNLARVSETVDGHSLPIPGARVIIAPHAGYEYSGANAAWAYSCLDLRNARRVFILGPSHTEWFRGCRVTTFSKFATPLGDLVVDRDTIKQIKETGEMLDMEPKYDIAEHSLEMHLPYIYRRCEQTFASTADFPQIVPITVGTTERAEEKSVGRLLLAYLKDTGNVFVISSDFCHWGQDRFGYTHYSADGDIKRLTRLRKTDPKPTGLPIFESIQLIDKAAMDAIKTGSHDAFVENLRLTGNTVCGRHPIGIAMAMLELYSEETDDQTQGRFRIVQYNRSNEVVWPDEFSVSYVSAYAII